MRLYLVLQYWSVSNGKWEVCLTKSNWVLLRSITKLAGVSRVTLFLSFEIQMLILLDCSIQKSDLSCYFSRVLLRKAHVTS